MELAGRICIVTGAGQGIGRAIAHAFAENGAHVVVSDIDPVTSQTVAEEVNGLAIPCDVSEPDSIQNLVDQALEWKGRIDLVCSNAGFAKGEPDGPTSATDDHWLQSYHVHVLAHLRLCRLVLPDMLARKEGYLINVASAAGLLSQIGDAAYSATKHAAVSLAQSLAIEHGDAGIDVSVMCPQYVATPLLGYDDGLTETETPGLLTAEAVAQSLLEGIQAKQFLILPHPEVGQFAIRRATDMDRWIKGMQKLRSKARDVGQTDLAKLHKLL